MTKNEFLTKPSVSSFITWLGNKVNTINIQVAIKSSSFVPGGLHFNTTGITSLMERYFWRPRWNDTEGNPMVHGDWKSTKLFLNSLHTDLIQAVADNSEPLLHSASCRVLKWGGVHKAKTFLGIKQGKKELVGYLSLMKETMTLATASLGSLNGISVQQFDSGLTKIHALLSDDGLPIYDSRVGAAIAAFVHLYRQETGGDITDLMFPVSAARGTQIRTLKGFPRLYSQASPAFWARSQVKLGWVLETVLINNPELFASEGALNNRMHAFEASMFILGYDLRAIPELGV